MSYKGFQIICLGAYCLPRVIATVCHFKATKAAGEKTCPFDLAFCWNFDAILENLDNEFYNFFDGIEYDYLKESKTKSEINNIFGSKLEAKFWKDEKSGFIFNHEDQFSPEEFKSRYQRRINNFYEYVKDENKEIYFLIATFSQITNEQINKLNNIISKYRHDGFYNIIINQSADKMQINSSNTHIINCDIDNIFYRGDWGLMLKEHEKYPLANELYKKINKELMRIILRAN